MILLPSGVINDDDDDLALPGGTQL